MANFMDYLDLENVCKTIGHGNLTKDRIAAEHGSFFR